MMVASFCCNVLNARDTADELSRWRSCVQTPARAELESYGHAVIPLHLPQTQNGVTLEILVLLIFITLQDGETYVAFVLQRFTASAEGIQKILTPVQVPSQCKLPLHRLHGTMSL